MKILEKITIFWDIKGLLAKWSYNEQPELEKFVESGA